MKFIIDISPALVNKTGIFHVVFDTCRHLMENHKCRFYAGRTELDDNVMDFSTRTLRLSDARKTELTKKIFYDINAAAQGVGIGLQIGFDAKIIFFDTIYALPHTLSHRHFAYILDLTPATFPLWHQPHVAEWYKKSYEKIAASECNAICISKSTASDFRSNYVVAPEHVHTAPLYLRGFPLSRDTDLAPENDGKYFLFVGSLEQRKNISSLLHAFNMTGLSKFGYKLKIAGSKGHGSSEIEALAHICHGVDLLGYVSDEILAQLYVHATAFVYPSLWEGFGMPLIEAMAHSCICIASDSSAVDEVGGNNVVKIDATSVESIASGMLAITYATKQDRMQMKQLSRNAALRFSLDNYIKNIDQIFLQHDKSVPNPSAVIEASLGVKYQTNANAR